MMECGFETFTIFQRYGTCACLVPLAILGKEIMIACLLDQSWSFNFL